MEKIKKKYNNLRIVPTFTLYTLLAVLIALFLTEIETSIVDNIQYDIAFTYTDIVEGYNSEFIWGKDKEIIYFSELDSRIIVMVQNIEYAVVPLTFVACSVIAAVLFYKHKIKHPLFLLTSSAAKISEHNLNFDLQYDKTDEMGDLCNAFEKMRSALDKNNRKMWQQVNDRKRLNAAFSHDLRTPLTVLEGNLDILKKYGFCGKLTYEDITETYSSMTLQIERLKNYVSSMNTLQRLEDIEIVAKNVNSLSFVSLLENTANIICYKKNLVFINEVNLDNLNIDAEIVLQVFENILANASRYAKTVITIKCQTEHKQFIIKIADDGNGFDDNALRYASDPFYTTEDKAKNVHFGIGLNICKILCERHGGNIMLCNNVNSGGSVMVTFGM